ncbi:ImcF-related family protein [Legionella sp. W05-934-2]|uniref:ImcF-related family protein n=1 Tax=Legionella sp. W05-934-2 TaxID=1198649 RepID=UPI00346287E1
MMHPNQKQLHNALKRLFKQLYHQYKQVHFALLIGKDRQGKNTFLSQSDFQSYDEFSCQEAKIYYQANQVVLLLSESWLMDNTLPLQKQIHLINRCHTLVPIQSILICINLQELVGEDGFSVNERLQTHIHLSNWVSQSLNKSIPCHLIITHADGITGFCDFFAQTLVGNDNLDLFGLSFDFHPDKTEKQIGQKLFQLTAHIQHMVIDKLHFSRSTIKRQLIREFPQQFSAYHRAVSYCIKAMSQTNLPVVGLYFVSSIQQGASFDPLNKRIKREYSLALPDHHNLATNYKPYFVQATLTHILKRHRLSSEIPYQRQIKIFGTAASILFVLAALYGIKQGFKANRELDYISDLLITHESYLSQTNDLNAALFHLTQASNEIEQLPHSLFYPKSLHKLEQQLSQKTTHALHQQFLPISLDKLKQVMQSSSSPVSDKFTALKVYLMLGSKQHFDEETVINWFKQRWQHLDVAEQNKQMALMRNALRPPYQPISIDQQIVKDTQNYLNALPEPYFYYMLAKDFFPNQKQHIEMPGFNLSTADLPIYFSKAGFESLKPKLVGIAQAINKDSWVLDKTPNPELAGMIEKSYCYAYRDWWKHFIEKSHPRTPNSFQDIEQITKQIHQNQSFSRFMQFIQLQTSPVASEYGEYFNRYVPSEFSNINLISQSAVAQVDQSIGELGQFTNQINLLEDRQSMVFNLTKARFKQPDNVDPLSVVYTHSQRLPEPLKSWTKLYADETWYHMLKDSQEKLNQLWQQEIALYYQQKLAHRFPIDEKGEFDINLNDFNAFFAKQGRLAQFTENHIKPFLQTDAAEWQVKEVNGYRMPFKDTVIKQFIQANIISTMFFEKETVTNVKFELQKIALDPTIERLEIVMDERKFKDTNDDTGENNDRQFTWPFNQTAIRIKTIEGKQFELEAHGPWALLHMLRNLSITADPERPHQLLVDLNVNGYSGRYILTSNSLINPLTPSILDQFELEDLLFN